MMIGNADVQFAKADNIELEKIYRMIFAKLAGALPQLVDGMNTDISKVDWMKITKEMLGDDDIKKIETILFKSIEVDGLFLDKPNDLRTILDRYSIFFYDVVMWEALKHFLGEHLRIALASGIIPKALTKLLTESMQKFKTVQASFGQQLKADTPTTQEQ
jgi:hypothetical protein